MFVLVALLGVAPTRAQVPVGTPDDVGLSAERLQRIGKMIERAIDADQISGASPNYLQFAQMLVDNGELNGKRLLGSRTVDLIDERVGAGLRLVTKSVVS